MGAKKDSGGLMPHLEGDDGEFDKTVSLSVLGIVSPDLSGIGSPSIRPSTR